MMATFRQFSVVGVRFPSPAEGERSGERGAIRQHPTARSWRVTPRGPENVFGTIGGALRIARELVLLLWLITALAFWLVVIAGCVL
jgi:hypothetical protein